MKTQMFEPMDMISIIGFLDALNMRNDVPARWTRRYIAVCMLYQVCRIFFNSFFAAQYTKTVLQSKIGVPKSKVK